MLVSGRAVPNLIQEWKSEGSSCSLPRSFHHTSGLLQSFGIKYPTSELLRKIWGNCWGDISNTLRLRHIWRHTHNIPLTYPYRKMQNTYKNMFFWTEISNLQAIHLSSSKVQNYDIALKWTLIYVTREINSWDLWKQLSYHQDSCNFQFSSIDLFKLSVLHLTIIMFTLSRIVLQVHETILSN